MDVSNNMKNKVMLALTVCQGYRLCDPDHCPYGDKVDGHECLDSLHEDALAMLKAQEPVTVIPAINGNDELLTEGCCPICGAKLDYYLNGQFCGCCGQAVKWE